MCVRRSSAGSRNAGATAARAPDGRGPSKRRPTSASSCCSSHGAHTIGRVGAHSGRAYASAVTCPLDGSEDLEPADGVDLAVHHTLTHGGSVVNVVPAELGDAEIGALLRFQLLLRASDHARRN